jgi:hypothetical protein
MMALNWAPISGKAQANYASSDHLDAGLPDSCVSCHLYQPAARMSGTLQLGGHGMYLSGDVHGSDTNVIGVCRSCHEYPLTSTGSAILVQPTSAGTGSLSGGFETALTPDTNINDRLADIRANRDLLIAYFGTGTNFLKTVSPFNPGVAGDGPIESLSGGDVASGEFGKDWVFAASRLTEIQSYAFWNFKLFIEDRSQGIHNPVYAHQILYDAAQVLSLTPVGTRP